MRITILCLLITLPFFYSIGQTQSVGQTQTATKDTVTNTVITQKSENLYLKGQLDAEKNYLKYKGAGAGTLVTSLLSPLVGLIPAVACSATAPQVKNLGYPDENLFKQQEYFLGYTQKAKKIKQRKVWTNWGIALGVNAIAILIINSSK